MLIITNKHKKVFSKKSDLKNDLTPKLLNTSKKSDEENTSQKFYEYEVYCEVDKESLLRNGISKILILASRDGIKSLSSRKKLMSSINTSNIQDVNYMLMNHELEARKSLKRKVNNGRVYTLGSFPTDKVINSDLSSKVKTSSRSDLYGTETVYKVSKRRSRSRKGSKTNQFTSKAKKNIYDIPNKEGFKNFYLNTVASGMDPACSVHNGGQNPQNFTERLSGLIPAGGMVKKNTQNGPTNLSGMLASIAESNTSQTTDIITSKKVIKKIDMISQKITIKESLIRELGSNFYFVFMAVDRVGKRIDFYEQTAGHTKRIEQNKDQPSINYDVSSTRRGAAVILKISNNSDKVNKFNIYRKILDNAYPSDIKDFELVKKNVQVNPKTTSLFFKDVNISKTNSVLYRVTTVYSGKEICNTKCASLAASSGTRHEPTLVGVGTKIESNGITLDISNVPSDITAVALMRRDVTTGMGSFQPVKTMTTEGTYSKLKPVKTNNSGTPYKITDPDVRPGRTYEYKVKVYRKNGTSYTTGAGAIETYEERSGEVQVSVLNSANPTPLDESSSTNSGLAGTSTHTVQLAVVQDDVNKLFGSMFGSLLTLFEDDLKEIKDASALTSVVEVTAMDLTTSETISLGDFPVDASGKCTFSTTLSLLSNYRLKIEPKVLPSSQVMTSIQGKLDSLASKSRFNTIAKYETGRIKKQSKNPKLVSSIGSKYSSKSSRTKGRIVDSNSSGTSNGGDLFFEGKTGDIEYIDVKMFNLKDTSVTVKGKKLTLIEDIESTKLKKDSKIKTNKYLVEFESSTSDGFVDFYTIYYQNDNSLTYSGVVHSKGYTASKNFGKNKYNYYSEIKGCIGTLQYYAMPVFKDGSVGSLTSIGTLTVI